MPGHEHEALVRLFRNDPALIATVLSRWLGHALPGALDCKAVDSNLTEAQPMELRADAVFLLSDSPRHTALAVVLEVQRDWDARKAWTWPAYAMVTRARHECHAIVLALTLDDATASRARQPIQVDPDQWWRPVVLGPDAIPRIVDPGKMRDHPELGILSALAHAHDAEDLPVALAAFEGRSAARSRRTWRRTICR